MKHSPFRIILTFNEKRCDRDNSEWRIFCFRELLFTWHCNILASSDIYFLRNLIWRLLTKIIKCECRSIHILNENIRYICVKLFMMNARSIDTLEVKMWKSLFEYYTESVENIHKEKYLPRIFHINIDFVISRLICLEFR